MSALHRACAADNLVLVSTLLEQGAAVNAKDKHGKTPLHIASARGNKLLAELLFQRGANPRAMSHDSMLPLDCTSDETMAALLTKIMVRAGLGELAKERLQFLHLPGERVRQRILKDIDKASTGRRTPPPFLTNLFGKSKSIVNMICPRESDSPRSSTSSVDDCSSTESGIAEMERNQFRSSNTSVESVRSASSGFASDTKHTPLRRRVTTPLTSEEFEAAIKLHKTTRSASDPQHASTSSRTQTSRPRRSDTITHRSCVSRCLTRFPKRVSFPSEVLLDVAIINDDFVEACHLIKSRKVDINRFEPNGLSPIHRAAIEGSCECLQLLIDQGANINIKDRFGWTPLHDAVFHGHVNCATILIRRGAELEAESNQFQTPLLLADSDDMILATGRALVAKESGDNCSQLMPRSFEPIADPERETCV